MDEARAARLESILVADDNSDTLALVRDILAAKGYRVLVARDGEAALRSLSIERPDLVLLDVHMPKMDGYETCRRIRENSSMADLPVLFLSGMDEAFNKVKAFEIGASDYIVKPFHAAELLARIKTHIGLSRSRAEVRAYASYLESLLEELRAAERRVVESEKAAAIAALGSGLAHELNNPVNYLVLGIEALSRNLDEFFYVLRRPEAGCLDEFFEETPRGLLLEESSRLLGGLREGAQRTERIVKRLVAYASPGREEPKDADVVLLLDSALSLLGGRDRNDIRVKLEYAAHPHIQGSPIRLTRLFHCVLENAFDAAKASTDPWVCVTLSIGGTGEEESIEVKVSDSGPGISPELRERIFDPFFTTKEMGQGAGLGLSLARGIALEHRGSLELLEPGASKNTTFRIRLPVRALEPSASKDIPAASRP